MSKPSVGPSVSLHFLRTSMLFSFFFFNDTATTEIYTLSLHDALPISFVENLPLQLHAPLDRLGRHVERSEEHTSELQSRLHLVCRLLLEKKKTQTIRSSPSCSSTVSTPSLSMSAP